VHVGEPRACSEGNQTMRAQDSAQTPAAHVVVISAVFEVAMTLPSLVSAS
jgi:hypothetical protein